jgi:hypothetical protein
MKPSRFEPMNRMTCEIFSLAPIGGEGWGEEAIRSASRFMGEICSAANHSFDLCWLYLYLIRRSSVPNHQYPD